MAAPPNGLQLILSSAAATAAPQATGKSASASPLTSHSKQTSDTLVMQNLGYYQLQAHSPGNRLTPLVIDTHYMPF